MYFIWGWWIWIEWIPQVFLRKKSLAGKIFEAYFDGYFGKVGVGFSSQRHGSLLEGTFVFDPSDWGSEVFLSNPGGKDYPVCFMYGIFIYIWLEFMVNLGSHTWSISFWYCTSGGILTTKKSPFAKFESIWGKISRVQLGHLHNCCQCGNAMVPVMFELFMRLYPGTANRFLWCVAKIVI